MGAAVKRLEVGERVREMRLARGLTQIRLAALVGLHPMTILKAEVGGTITWRTAKRLGEVLDVDPRELVTTE
jgi:transcriptional regulator with XRE-family HTH domain